MNVRGVMRRLLFLVAVSVIAASPFLYGQATQDKFEPQVGQAGKDVVWVPTPQALVDKMLDLAKVTPQDFLMDLGSGDGRTVITAAKRGTRAMGIEYNPDMVELSQRNAKTAGVTNATFVKADLFETDFSKATVITMFLLPEINLKLRPKILNMRPGTRVVSNSFTMGEWEADQTEMVGEGCTSWCTALFWIVPAKVDGAWKLPQGELTLKQNFQMVSGTLKSSATSTTISNGRIRGDQIGFDAGGTHYQGKINGSTMEGTITSGASWRATR